jgi:DNA adenine methylase
MRCNFCGYDGPLEDFDEDFTHHSGVWCPNCDSFTLFDDNKEKARIFTLYLEDTNKGAMLTKFKKVKQNVSPLRYPGGKTKLVPYIAGQLPDNIKRIVEPYCGGSSVSLSLLLSGLVEDIVINDIDVNVYSLFHVILSSPTDLINRIENEVPDRKTYFIYRESLKQDDFLSELERAYRFLYCNRLAFSGIFFSNPMKKINARWNPNTLIKRIKKIWQYREHIKLYNMDAVTLIEEEYWSGSDTLLFIDPPYYKKGNILYRKAYYERDHLKLSWLLESLYREVPGAHIIITYDNSKEIEDMYCIPQIETIKPQYCIANQLK